MDDPPEIETLVWGLGRALSVDKDRLLSDIMEAVNIVPSLSLDASFTACGSNMAKDILAGPKPQQKPGGAESRDPLSITDPWASYLAKTAGPQAPVARTPAGRTADGPTEARFAVQDARLQKLETTIEALQTSHKEANAHLENKFKEAEQKQAIFQGQVNRRCTTCRLTLLLLLPSSSRPMSSVWMPR